jgi:predicted dehydrogenase
MIRVGVVGVGHLGRFHVEKYRAMDGIELVGVADISHRRARSIAEQFGTKAFYDHRDLLGQVDAVSVVVPTQDHFTVARSFMENGVHVLLEKPITRTLEEADTLIALAREKSLVFQVGHLERFNPAMEAASALTGEPLFIEINRIGPFPERGTDVDVVLDLMIHDIDITLNIVQAEPRWISAVGVPVVTPRVDIANARLEFDTGCVANLNASRISVKTQRKIRIFQQDAYLSIDLAQHQVSVIRRTPATGTGWPGIRQEELTVEPNDALEKEIKSFISAVGNGDVPFVTGEDGRRALVVALRIMAKIKARLGDWFDDRGRIPV